MKSQEAKNEALIGGSELNAGLGVLRDENNRFVDTLAALKDCQEYIDYNGNAALEGEEREACRQLIRLCKQLADDYATTIW